jgi:hypothetical protein
MKAYAEVEGRAPTFLTSALDEGGFPDSRPDRFILGIEPQISIRIRANLASESFWTL